MPTSSRVPFPWVWPWPRKVRAVTPVSPGLPPPQPQCTQPLPAWPRCRHGYPHLLGSASSSWWAAPATSPTRVKVHSWPSGRRVDSSLNRAVRRGRRRGRPPSSSLQVQPEGGLPSPRRFPTETSKWVCRVVTAAPCWGQNPWLLIPRHPRGSCTSTGHPDPGSVLPELRAHLCSYGRVTGHRGFEFCAPTGQDL